LKPIKELFGKVGRNAIGVHGPSVQITNFKCEFRYSFQTCGSKLDEQNIKDKGTTLSALGLKLLQMPWL
jgi:hypothetical protein